MPQDKPTLATDLRGTTSARAIVTTVDGICFPAGKPVLAIDWDDVVSDFNRPFLAWHNIRYGTNVKYEDIGDFALHVVYGVEEGEFKKRARLFMDEKAYLVGFMAGFKEALPLLLQHFDVQVVTARPPCYEMIMRIIIIANGLNWNPIIHFGNSGLLHDPSEPSEDKGSICERIGAIALIEDAPHNAEAVAAKGISVFLLPRPWNEEHVFSESKIRRAAPEPDGWRGITNQLIKRFART